MLLLSILFVTFVLSINSIFAAWHSIFTNWLTCFPFPPIYCFSLPTLTCKLEIFLERQFYLLCQLLYQHHALSNKLFVPWCRMMISGEQSFKKTLKWWGVPFVVAPDIPFTETEGFKCLSNLHYSRFSTIGSPKIKVFFLFFLVFLSNILLILSAFLFSVFGTLFEPSPPTLFS